MSTLGALWDLLAPGLQANADLLALLVAYYGVSRLAVRWGARAGQDAASLADLAFWVAVGALIGARLAQVSPSLVRYLQRPLDLVRIGGGLYYYGGLAGGILAGILYARRRRLGFWPAADVFGLFAPLLVVVARFACLVNNTCYGAQAPPPLGVVFPGLTRPRYPSDLYEGLLALALFGLLLLMAQRRPRPGVLFLLFVGGYASIRALVDLTRIASTGWPLAADPYLSLVTAVGALAVLGLRWRRATPSAVTTPAAPHPE